MKLRWLAAVPIFLLTGYSGRTPLVVEAGTANVPTYYVAADELDWNSTIPVGMVALYKVEP